MILSYFVQSKNNTVDNNSKLQNKYDMLKTTLKDIYLVIYFI